MENVDFPILNHSGGTCGAIFCIFRQGTYTLQTRFSGFLTIFCLVRKRDIFWTKFQAQGFKHMHDAQKCRSASDDLLLFSVSYYFVFTCAPHPHQSSRLGWWKRHRIIKEKEAQSLRFLDKIPGTGFKCSRRGAVPRSG